MSASHPEVGGSDGAPPRPTDGKGMKDPFALLVLIGCVEYAPDEGRCCCEIGRGEGRGELTGKGPITSGILPLRPDPEDCGVGWGSVSPAPVLYRGREPSVQESSVRESSVREPSVQEQQNRHRQSLRRSCRRNSQTEPRAGHTLPMIKTPQKD